MCSRLISHTYVSLVLFETMTIAIKSLQTSLNIIFMEVLEIYSRRCYICAVAKSCHVCQIHERNEILRYQLISHAYSHINVNLPLIATMTIVIKSVPVSLNILQKYSKCIPAVHRRIYAFAKSFYISQINKLESGILRCGLISQIT